MFPSELKTPVIKMVDMNGARSSDFGSRNRPRVGHMREKGMRSVSRITRLTVAVSLMLSAVFSAIAAIGFAGRTSAKASGSSVTSVNGTTPAVRIALPPKNQGEAPSAPFVPPVAPPVSQPVVQAPPVTSGGS